MRFIIYQIQNKINDKKYIGFSSKSLEERWNKHCCDAKNGRKTYLCNAIRKHGKENFAIEVLHCCENLNITRDILEELYINKIGSHYLKGFGYNMTFGGEGTMGHKHSEETKKKMSKSHTGKKHSEDTKQKISDQKTGCGNPNFGRVFSKEHREKIGLAGKGSKNPRAKQYHVTTPAGETLTIADRMGFCEQHGLKYFSVTSSIRRGHSYRGYTFTEIKNEPPCH